MSSKLLSQRMGGMTARSVDTNDTNVDQNYAKDSFDRFGDDLCQYLLTYLSLEDRFRFQCLSKQWQRVVYHTQKHIIFDSKSIIHKVKPKTFDSILQKCGNI